MAAAETFPADEEDALSLCCLLLKEECDPTHYQTAISTLLKILRNVLANPTEAKYKELKMSNKMFSEKVWHYSGAQQFLIAAGWAEVDDKVMLLDSQFLSQAVAVLEKASSSNQNGNGATNVSSQPQRQQTQKDKEIEEIRRKQMEQVLREKEERKRISDMIKSDRKENETKQFRNSVARRRQFGGNINRFEDIGVDLNGGGGG